MFKLQSYKKIRVIWLATYLTLLCSSAFAGSRYNSTTGAKDFCVSVSNASGTVANDKCYDIRVPNGSLTQVGTLDRGGYFSLLVGTQTSGATSMTSAEVTVSTSYTYVRKAIAEDPAYSSGTMANGTAGQFLTFFVTTVAGAGTFTITPTTKTGFTSVVFDAAKDSATFLYVDNTVGWILVAWNSVTVNIP